MRISPFVLAASLAIGGLTAASAAEYGSRSVVYPAYGYAPYGYAPYGYARVGYPARVSCQFPDGWNSADASRALRGIPNGMNHTCRVNAAGTPIDSSGAPTE